MTGRAVAVIALLMNTASFAQERQTDRLVSGNELYRHCSERAASPAYTTSAAYCVGYVSAVNDTLNSWLVLEGRQAFCLPPGSNAGQLADIVRVYLRDNPSTRHFGAATLVMSALLEAFPCNRS